MKEGRKEEPKGEREEGRKRKDVEGGKSMKEERRLMKEGRNWFTVLAALISC
jgi:hypothetical protein